MQFNIGAAKKQWESLVERAAAGEEIVIARRGKPIAKLLPVTNTKEPRTPGGWEGRIWIAPDFDESDAEIEALFYGVDPDDPLSSG